MIALAVAMTATVGYAQETRRAEFLPIKDDPGLPRVLNYWRFDLY